MSVDITRAVAHTVGHAVKEQREKGNHNTAAGLALLAMGFFLLPIPIVGIPMMIVGIIKLCKGD